MSIRSLKSPSAAIVKGSKLYLNKEVVSCVIPRRSSADKPSPNEFDKFLPWVCLQFEVLVEVTVIKAALEKQLTRRKTGSFSSKSSRLKTSSQVLTSPEAKVSSKHRKTLSDPNLIDKIPITAYYDSSGHLAEIAILKSPFFINGKIIKSINLCLPFHPALFKISMKSGLTSKVLYEVAKMLPHSNITDVCLDDCYIPEGNYFILLDYISPLKVLSLKRCKINDIVCMEIAKRIDLGEAGSTLSVLDLGSNEITDRGVWYIADVLRRNRSLVHLNLSSNKITDCGLMYIMNHLKEFPMNQEEIIGRKKRRYELLQRIELSRLEKSDDTVTQGTQVHFRYGKGRPKSAKKKKQSALEMTNVSAVAVTKEKFNDVFDDTNIVVRDGSMYCIGNFTLCSLNLAYNDLDYFSAKRILDVLSYQSKMKLGTLRTGLLRLVLEGNLIPQTCEEINDIRLHLNPALSTRIQSQRMFRSRSTLIRK